MTIAGKKSGVGIGGTGTWGGDRVHMFCILNDTGRAICDRDDA